MNRFLIQNTIFAWKVVSIQVGKVTEIDISVVLAYFPDGYYLGEINMFALTYSPGSWKLCNGEILNIQENQELYSLVDTQFGEDGKKTFALPNLKDASEKIKLLYAIADISDDPVSPF